MPEVLDDIFTRRRGKPLGKWGKLSDDQLRVLHKMHIDREVSARELARAIADQVGYASEGSALEGIRLGWRRLGLPPRGISEATALSNRQRRVPGSPGTADRKANRRFHLKRRGGLRRCKGVKLAYPEKGRPCYNYALTDSDYCLQHDESHRDRVVAIVAEARSKLAIGSAVQR